MPSRASPIDALLARLPARRRALLEELRRTIVAAVPAAEECLSYGVPAFRLGGRIVAGFAATRTGGSYYPFSGATLSSLAKHLEGFSRTRGALHFTEARPLPATLVRRLLAVRRAEIARAPVRTTRRRRAPLPKQPAPGAIPNGSEDASTSGCPRSGRVRRREPPHPDPPFRTP
jgi:uncharacterized protein YdhG (YjbR/CyaY superfamily)